MDNFKTFQEDLASGRPAKKPVSSNLLKQRAKDNEKALKSGFMKMPDYVKKKFNEEKKNCGCGQDPCITYGKKQMKESTRDNYNPKISDVRNKEKMRKVGLPAGKGPLVSEEKQKGVDGKVCWKGYKRMGTKKKGGKTVDNCVKVEDFVLDAFENYYLAELSPQTISSYQKKAGKEYSDLKKSTMSATSREGGYHKGYISQKEYDAQHDMAAKKRQRGKGLAMSKGKGVQKEGAMKRLATDKAEKERLQKRKEPSAYRFPDKDGKATPLYRKEQMQLVTNLDLEESIANLVKRGVGKVKDSLQQAGQQYKDSQEKSMKAGKGIYSNPVSGDNIRKRMKQMQSQKKR